MHISLVHLLLVATTLSTPKADRARGLRDHARRDTVALESFTRTATRVEGDIMVRIPGTVLCHYVLELAADGSVTRSTLDVKPIGASSFPRVTSCSNSPATRCAPMSTRQAIARSPAERWPENAFPQFMTGYGDSYGLYSSLGVYEALHRSISSPARDTVAIPSVNMATGRTVPRLFLRRSPTLVDADYFKIAWTHLTLDASGKSRAPTAARPRRRCSRIASTSSTSRSGEEVRGAGQVGEGTRPRVPQRHRQGDDRRRAGCRDVRQPAPARPRRFSATSFRTTKCGAPVRTRRR